MEGRDPEREVAVANALEADGPHRMQEILLVRERFHRLGQVGVSASRTGDRAADARQHVAEIEPEELAHHRDDRLRELEDRGASAGSEKTIDLGETGLVGLVIAQAESYSDRIEA